MHKQLIVLGLLAALAALVAATNNGERAAVQIIVDNRRSANTVVHCCSGDDDLCQRSLDPNRYYNFAFTPSIWGNTVFNCRATFALIEDPVTPVIRTFYRAWTAYGEWEGVNQGSAIFELRDDGIYWDNQFMAMWQNTTVFPPSIHPTCDQHPTPCLG